MRSNGSPLDGQFGELGEDIAAARRLFAQQPHVVAMRRVGGNRILQLLGNHRNSRQRRAEFVRGGGRQSVELREMLLARQHQFGGGQRVGELARFLGDLPSIDADEADGEQDREPDADHVDRRQLQRIVAVPRQRIMREHQHGRAGHREGAEHQREARRQRGRRQQHRTQEQEGERILQSAGQEQQHRQFGDVEGEQPGGAVGLQPLRHVETQAQRHVEPGRQRDHREAGPDRQRKIEPEIDHQHGGGLADDGEPTQPYQRVEAHIAARMILGEAECGHGRQCNAPSQRRKIDGYGRGLRFLRRGVTSCVTMDAQNTSAIAVDRLVKLYKGVAAVDGISFRLAPGSITGLLGGNGAGKTTTIAMIMGLVTPTAGTVSVLGAQMPRERYRVLHRMNFESPYVACRCGSRCGKICRCSRSFTLSPISMSALLRLPPISISPNFSTGRPASCRPARRPASRSPRRCSTAPKCCCSTSRRHRSIPTPPTGCATGSIVIRRAQGATVLLASHNMTEVERLCERVIIMKTGRIEDDDTPQRLLDRYGRETLEEVFLDVARGRAEHREAAQ